MCRSPSLRYTLLVVALFQAGCGRTDRNGLQQPVATSAVDMTSASAEGSTSAGEAGATDATTASAASTTGVAAGGASSNSAGSEGLAVGGASGGNSTEGSAADGGPATSVDVSGNWAMFFFEDPVAVSLQQDGTELHGIGCCGGLNTELDFCCAPIAGGKIEGRHVQFGFPVDAAAGVYMADVFVSEDGERMAGPFHSLSGWGVPTAWVRIAYGEAWLPRTNVQLADQLSPYAGSFTLTLTHAEPVSVFTPNTDYALHLTTPRGVFVFGDLGSFWEGELSWDESSETLLAGPVPETHPDLPIELRLSFAGTELLEVVATFAAGEATTFLGERRTRW